MDAAPDTRNPWPSETPDRNEAIRKRAEEIYIRNGRIPGRDAENWAQAEQEISREFASPHPQTTAIVVRVNGEEYVGEYNPDSSDGYHPGEFGAGVSVPSVFAATKCS